MTKLKFDPIDRGGVQLTGVNLVEASAGTGKTYSIGILVIRLIIEKQLPIEKILMVTFTNAAVAELEERIRKFVRLAYKSACGKSINDKGIEKLIQEYISDESLGGKDQVIKLLKNARRSLDDTSIFTIHSFCQHMLTEFALETGQLYGMDLLNNIDELIQEEVDDFWRVHIAGLSKELVLLMQQDNPSSSIELSRSLLVSSVKQFFNGTKYCGSIGEYSSLLNERDQLYSLLNLPKELMSLGTKTSEKWHEYMRNPKLFFSKLTATKSKKVIALFSEELDAYNVYRSNVAYSIAKIHLDATAHIVPIVQNKLIYNKCLSTNDLISNLHAALDFTNASSLIKAIKNKYKAVFVDEFQDTDSKQYEIFSRIFSGPPSVMFYIGDPKQSIYAFRQADINTYFKASDEVDRVYGMETNYRSSSNLIQAMNTFFTGNNKKGFDTFHTYNGSRYKVDYIKVNAINEDCEIWIEDQVEKPLTVYDGYKNTKDICNDVGAKIVKLLKQGIISVSCKKVIPSDIVVLVSNRFQAQDIKNELNRRKVPSIILSDQKVFGGNEGKYIAHILGAVADPKRNKINLALLIPFTGYSYATIEQLNDEIELQRFKDLSHSWENEGVYSVLKKFASLYGLENNLLGNDSNDNGERMISNYFQIADILQRTEAEKKYSKNDLIRFLHRNIADTSVDNEEYVQRIESDEAAVRIVTIHKSKGLEYNIVFAPFLDIETKERKSGFSTFRSADNTYYHSFAGHLKDNMSLFLKEQEQENRRILYVALTRAKYACYLFKKEDGSKITTFDPFYQELLKMDPDNSQIFIGSHGSASFEKWEPVILETEKVYHELPQIYIKDNHWRKMSYSYLSGDHAYVKKELKNPEYQSDYDKFIFNELPKGAHVGNLLHNMFEFIDYSDSNAERIKNAVSDSLRIFLPKYKIAFQEPLEKMITTVLSTEIEIKGTSFKLNEVGNESKKTELEFDFMTNKFNVEALNVLREYLPEGFDMHTRCNEEIKGVLTGFVDLFFENNGKYYILDWKSNFLGDEIEDYSKDKLKHAMSDSNYHLQYLIYSLAIKKFLETKLNEFDYEKHFGGVIYLFLRGVRENSQSGVFTYRPDVQIINKLETILSAG